MNFKDLNLFNDFRHPEFIFGCAEFLNGDIGGSLKNLLRFQWVLLAFCALVVAAGCGKRQTQADHGYENQILHLSNGVEPEELDPQISRGVQEDRIAQSLLEGLVSEDPVDLHPIPGVAERWDISEDKKTYTFHLRKNAKWSNGDPVTAKDFEQSYKRALSPKFGNPYAYFFFYVVGAEDYHKGKTADYTTVGVKALDDYTLEIRLINPTSYFLSLLNHHSWLPVHIPTVLKHGKFDERGNKWTRAGNFVGNGPFQLAEWKVNHLIRVVRNPHYWDAKTVKLNEIYFYPIESLDSEERAYRARQIHKTNKLPLSKIEYYREQNSPHLRLAPYLGTYFYMFNTTNEFLKDKRVRQALTFAVDREAIVKSVSRGGELPAYSFTPPNTIGYTSKAKIGFDPEKAKKLLAEAGYPEGRGFPKITLLYNTLESHKTIAEAVQQMWKVHLNVEIVLQNQEWKVYLATKVAQDYQIARYGWIADYVDPNAFLDLWLTESGNNESSWSNKEYDRLIAEAGKALSNEERFEHFQKAEAILLDELPILPIYHYTSAYLLDPSIKNWNPTLLDHQPYKYVYLEKTEVPLLPNREQSKRAQK